MERTEQCLAGDPHKASFRDPAGFVYHHEGMLYRQVNACYRKEYDKLMESRLYERLVNKNWLVPHNEVDRPGLTAQAYKILQPSKINFISYPYEWCFSQLKDAALRTLDIQDMALEHDMTLKDASSYNIQFAESGPIFIDTLSFATYQEGSPWEAYRQFCQHFLAPLALMSRVDVRLNQLLRVYIDGIPLDLASKLLPFSTRFDSRLLLHIHLHARMQKKHAESGANVKQKNSRRVSISKVGLKGIIASLRKAIRRLHWEPVGTEWVNYYQSTNYSDTAFKEKTRLVQEFLSRVNPKMVWDLGANTGQFSRIATSKGALAVAFDVDMGAVEVNYRQLSAKSVELLPLVVDLTNPSPSLGWHSSERDSLTARGPADCVLALALIHHLAISNNLPFDLVAYFFADVSRNLIIEYVPKDDSQVQRLLSSRPDIFVSYTVEGFETAFEKYFSIVDKRALSGSGRILYLMTNNTTVRR
jgi:ribosomal protein L11 methylase PrmA